MNTTQTETLIGTLTVLGMLVLVTLPALIGAARERRIDRQIKEAERRAATVDGHRPERHTQGDARGTSSQRIARAA